jgi:ubiquitin thioesterase OTU1
MRLRLRAPAGASTITLSDDATVGDLINEIIKATTINKFDLKYGYPPIPLPLDQSDPSKLLGELGVKLNGEQLTVSPNEDTMPKGGKVTNKDDKSALNAESRSSAKLFTLKKMVMDSDPPEISFRGGTVSKSSLERTRHCKEAGLKTQISHAAWSNDILLYDIIDHC